MSTVLPFATPDDSWASSQALTTTSNVNLIAGLAGRRRHLVWLHAINTGAAAVDLIVRDGATVIFTIPLPVNVPVDIHLPMPMPVSAGAAVAVSLSAAGTVRVNALGYTDF